MVQADDRVSFTVLGPDGVVEAVDVFLAFLTDINRSVHTVRAYGYDLRFWFEHLTARGQSWHEATLDDVASFVAWYRRTRAGSDPTVVALDGAGGRSPRTVNRALAALFAFYDFHDDAPLSRHLDRYRRSSTARQKLVGRALRGPRSIRLAEPRALPKTLTGEQVQRVVAACTRLRDRLLVGMWLFAGLRVGATLGLRHEDVDGRRGVVRVVPRDNPNGARTKTGGTREVPLLPALVRLHADYLHEEYGDLDSDFVFVNLWGEPRGAPMTYSGVVSLARRLSARAGVEFTPHACRHTFATELRRNGARIEAVSELLLHRSVETTASIYTHLEVEDLRRELQAASDGRCEL